MPAQILPDNAPRRQLTAIRLRQERREPSRVAIPEVGAVQNPAFVCRDNGLKLGTDDVLSRGSRRRTYRARFRGCGKPMCDPNAICSSCTTLIAPGPVDHYICVKKGHPVYPSYS